MTIRQIGMVITLVGLMGVIALSVLWNSGVNPVVPFRGPVNVHTIPNPPTGRETQWCG